MANNKFTDLTGQKFNRLTVIRYAGKNNRHASSWECLCDCGNIKIIEGYSIKKNDTKSCGCLKSETSKILIRKNIDNKKHGMSLGAFSEYWCWQNIKKRCYSSKDKCYYLYGGKGIKMCDKWLSSFENFFEDMGKKPTPKHSLDRFPDKNGNYEPSNCRWATMKEQSNNRNDNVFIEFNGIKLTIPQWAERIGKKAGTLRQRIYRSKWSIEKSLTH